jgi:CubicO group peptidase (beta-lactamase class C family)
MHTREQVDEALDELYRPEAPHGVSLATVVMHRGQMVAERYGHQPDSAFGSGGPVSADTTLVSWSMAKSITHAAVGVLVGEGRLTLRGPAAVPEFAGTPKEGITLLDLLEMRSGLAFVEDYVDGAVSNCIEMLFGAGQHDMAAYAATLPLAHEPGSVWNYSSGTTNIIARLVGDVVGGGRHGMEQFLRDRLFRPCSMASATPKFDGAGTFVGSSYVYATARDFARFGELYRNDGVGPGGVRVLPAGWAAHAAAPVAHDDEFDYGRHWWVWRDMPGVFAAHGYEGQYTVVVPQRELVITHLGKSPVDRRQGLLDLLRAVIAAFPETQGMLTAQADFE